MIGYIERKMRESGEPIHEIAADLVVAAGNLFGNEIPFEKESKYETVRFSGESREILESKRYKIYWLTGKSLKTLKKEGHAILTTWDIGYHDEVYYDFVNRKSLLSEVAVRPDDPFLPDSYGKTLKEQQEMIAVFSGDLGIDEACAIIGTPSDYIELATAHSHSGSTDIDLFGGDNALRYACTATIIDFRSSPIVGGTNCLDVSNRDPKIGYSDVGIVPLIVPQYCK